MTVFYLFIFSSVDLICWLGLVYWFEITDDESWNLEQQLFQTHRWRVAFDLGSFVLFWFTLFQGKQPLYLQQRVFRPESLEVPSISACPLRSSSSTDSVSANVPPASAGIQRERFSSARAPRQSDGVAFLKPIDCNAITLLSGCLCVLALRPRFHPLQ